MPQTEVPHDDCPLGQVRPDGGVRPGPLVEQRGLDPAAAMGHEVVLGRVLRAGPQLGAPVIDGDVLQIGVQLHADRQRQDVRVGIRVHGLAADAAGGGDVARHPAQDGPGPEHVLDDGRGEVVGEDFAAEVALRQGRGD